MGTFINTHFAVGKYLRGDSIAM